MAEENGMEVLDKLADNPVSSKDPVGVETLSSQQEDRLSSRYTVCYGHPIWSLYKERVF